MDKRCGTSAGYMAARRRGEAPCADCKRAWRERQREYRLRKETNRDDPAR